MRWVYEVWMWYWGRWEECWESSGPDDAPEMLHRVGEWLSWHLFVFLAVLWALLGSR